MIFKPIDFIRPDLSYPGDLKTAHIPAGKRKTDIGGKFI